MTEALNTIVLGVSKDPIPTHEKFIQKYGLPFELLSDEEGKWLELFGVWKEKNMYGKTTMGIERSTFLIDEKGEILREWRKVSVPGHVTEVLEAAKSL